MDRDGARTQASVDRFPVYRRAARARWQRGCRGDLDLLLHAPKVGRAIMPGSGGARPPVAPRQLFTSALISIFAVAALDYYFTGPLFSPLIFDPVDGLAIVLYLLTAGVITMLVSRLRRHGEQLTAANAALEEQIAEVKYAQDQVNLARVNRVTLMGELTASIAHEVNQPLTGILAHAGTALRYLARDVPDIHEAQQYLNLVVRDSKRAGEVIAHIRALARKTPPRTHAVDIGEAILEVVSLTRRELQSNRVELRTELQDGLPYVQADKVQVQQVILNLIVNAIEAMHDLQDGHRDLVLRSGSIDTKHDLRRGV